MLAKTTTTLLLAVAFTLMTLTWAKAVEEKRAKFYDNDWKRTDDQEKRAKFYDNDWKRAKFYDNDWKRADDGEKRAKYFDSDWKRANDWKRAYDEAVKRFAGAAMAKPNGWDSPRKMFSSEDVWSPYVDNSYESNEGRMRSLNDLAKLYFSRRAAREKPAANN